MSSNWSSLKSLKGITGASLSELRRRAARGDSTTYNPSISILGRKEEGFDAAGAARKVKTPSSMAIQDQLKTDISIIWSRNYLDPKKFYKSSDNFDGKVLQVGTVIEGSDEFYSSRLAKKDRRQNITEEIMADATVKNYAKCKYIEVQQERAKPRRKVSSRGRKRC
jgi:hypothetical protein